MPIQFKQPLALSSLSERAYELLKQEIISGNLVPGEKLDIYELAEKMRISRTPVKDAINRLAHQGLVTIRNRRATFVSTIEEERIRELFDIRLMMELWGAARACRERESVGLERLDEILNECEPLVSESAAFDYERFNEYDMEFHLYFIDAARNAELRKLYQSLNVHIQAMRVYWRQARRPALESHNEHIAIFKSLCQGEVEKVKGSLTTHIIRSRDDVMRVLGERRGQLAGVLSSGPPSRSR